MNHHMYPSSCQNQRINDCGKPGQNWSNPQRQMQMNRGTHNPMPRTENCQKQMPMNDGCKAAMPRMENCQKQMPMNDGCKAAMPKMDHCHKQMPMNDGCKAAMPKMEHCQKQMPKNDGCHKPSVKSDCSCSTQRPVPQQLSKSQMLQYINEVSFAVNDILLYLDTHPCDHAALAYYEEHVAMRKAALDDYAKYFGPLTVDTADLTHCNAWEWVMQPWPWEGGSC